MGPTLGMIGRDSHLLPKSTGVRQLMWLLVGACAFALSPQSATAVAAFVLVLSRVVRKPRRRLGHAIRSTSFSKCRAYRRIRGRIAWVCAHGICSRVRIPKRRVPASAVKTRRFVALSCRPVLLVV